MPASAPSLTVFVSYARDDHALADEIVAALEWAGYRVVIDRLSIIGAEDWRLRLGALIAAADTVVFLLSAHSAASTECSWEVDEARRLSKRLLPVLLSPVGRQPVHPALAALNYVRFDAHDDGRPRSFVGAMRELQRALDSNLDWLREHTRLMARADEWQRADRAADRLLRGSDVAAAQRWAAERPADAPELTGLHTAFIEASDLAERERQDSERSRLAAMTTAQAERRQALDDREVAVKTVARRTALGIAGASVLGLGAGVAGWRALRAERQTLALRAQQQSLQAQQQADRQALQDRQAELGRLRELTRDEATWGRLAEGANAPPRRTVLAAAPALSMAPAVSSWAVHRVGAGALRYNGVGVTVAIIDSGIDIAHPAFAGIEVVEKDFTGEGHGDGHGHGTLLASLVAGRDLSGQRYGIAPGVSRLVMVKYIGVNGTASPQSLPAALDWVLGFDSGIVDVVCLGFGQSMVNQLAPRDGAARADRAEVSRQLAAFAQSYRTTEGIVNAAAVGGKGALIFSAAGNDNAAGQGVRVNSPTALARGVISVGAAEEQAQALAIASWSNVGVTLVAPGGKVKAAGRDGRLTEISGTSIACAVAAGTAALWWQKLRADQPGRSVAATQVWAAMKAAVRTDVFAPGVADESRGLGLVQAPPTA